MINSTGLEWTPQPPGDAVAVAIEGLSASGVAHSLVPDHPAGEGEASPLDGRRPDATVGWLLLHARQHMQGRT